MTREEAIESFKKCNEQAKVQLEVNKMYMEMGEVKELKAYIERNEMAIQALEERKEGKWLHFAQGDECPFCGWNTGKYEPADNFCPHCGAKLKDGEKSPRDSTKELKEFLK